MVDVTALFPLELGLQAVKLLLTLTAYQFRQKVLKGHYDKNLSMWLSDISLYSAMVSSNKSARLENTI